MELPTAELTRFLNAHGIGPWVTDNHGCNRHIDDWAAEFVDHTAAVYADETADAIAAMELLRDLLTTRPTQKSFSRTALMKILSADPD